MTVALGEDDDKQHEPDDPSTNVDELHFGQTKEDSRSSCARGISLFVLIVLATMI